MRQDTFDIAPARADEAEALTTLVRTSAAYDGQYRVMVAGQQLDAAYLATNLVRVAHGRGGRLWGFYSLLVPGRGGEGEGELDFMFVANHLQGRGIGRALFEDMRAMANQLGLSRVHIVSHPPSEPFYLARGTRRIGVIPPTGRITWRRPHLALDLRAGCAASQSLQRVAPVRLGDRGGSSKRRTDEGDEEPRGAQSGPLTARRSRSRRGATASR